MIHSRKRWKPGAVMLGSCMLLGISTASIAETQLSVENDGLALTAIVSSSKDILSTSIRVVGPDGFVFEDRFEDSTLQWVPEGNLADGRYNWEVRTVTVTPGAPIIEISAPQAAAPNPTGQQSAGESSDTSTESAQPAAEIPIERYFEEADKRVHTESGSFEVRDGWMAPNVNEQEAISRLEPARPGLLGYIAGAMIDFVFPSAHADQVIADDLTIQEFTPCLRYDDSDSASAGVEWNVCAFDGDGYIINNDSISAFTGNATFAIEEGAPNSSLFVESTGDIGFGTNTPVTPLHIVDGLPAIRFDDSTDAQIWNLGGEGNSGGRFFVNDATAGTTPFRIDAGAPTNALRIDASGNVGIGTDPAENLHIKSSTGSVRQRWDNSAAEYWEFWHGGSAIFWQHFDGTTTTTPVKFYDDAPTNSLVVRNGGVGVGTSIPDFTVDVASNTGLGQIRITETNGSNGLTMFALENTGHPRFRLRNSALNSNWDFRTAGSGSSEQFQITNISGGTSNFPFRLFKNGDLEVEGDVTANGVLLTSSRASKTDFAPLDERDVLERLASLEISQWRYKHESEDTVHFGPVAEEFHETFGLSDGKHLNMIDTNGIAFAAIKALKTENERLMRRLEALESKFEL